MSSTFYLDAAPHLSGMQTMPATRGPFVVGGMGALARQTIASDPIGNFTLTLDNIVIGSAIQIETQSGVALANRTSTTASELFNLVVYAPGSPLNSLRIKVRKGSASPFYRPFETQATATAGAQTIFVSQIPDE